MLALFLIFASFVTLTIGIFAFNKRDETTSLPFAAIMFAATIHTFGYAFELLSKTRETLLMWLNIEYVGVAFFPVLLIWFCYSNFDEEKKRHTVTILSFFTISLTTFFLVQTNNYHHFYYSQIIIHQSDQLILETIKGPWYYVQGLSIFVTLFILFISTLKMYKHSIDIYRRKAKGVLISLVIFVVGVLSTALNLIPSTLDVFPLLYVIIGIIWFSTYLGNGVFDLMPITYKKIFDNISEGVMVLDKNDHLAHFNMAAYDVFKSEVRLIRGLPISKVLDNIFVIPHNDYTGKVFEVRFRNKIKIYHLKSTDLYGQKGYYNGKILVFNDITKEVEAGRVLKALATQDALTGLSNRRHFFDRCHDKIEHARIEGKKISFVLMDLDHFKTINDTYGHTVGDVVLKEVSKLCQKTLREYDIMGRYGGEEFAILLYDTSLHETHMIIERMRDTIQSHTFDCDGNTIKLTVSFGVHRPNLLDEDDMSVILKKADKSLYQAKHEGRNRVVYYTDYVDIR